MSSHEYAAFDKDVQTIGSYQYTVKDKLSTQVANRRLTEIAQKLMTFKSKTVIDVGCGDGTYSLDLFRETRPKSMLGFDPAKAAIQSAQKSNRFIKVKFEVGDASRMKYKNKSFDVAHIRGVLHHADQPAAIVAESLRVAKKIIIIDPNGYNPILKLIEKLSPYHREHRERSFFSTEIDSWITDAGGTILQREWVGLVPFFCPDWMVKMLKPLEPVVEAIPGVKQLGCAVYVVTAASSNSDE